MRDKTSIVLFLVAFLIIQAAGFVGYSRWKTGKQVAIPQHCRIESNDSDKVFKVVFGTDTLGYYSSRKEARDNMYKLCIDSMENE